MNAVTGGNERSVSESAHVERRMDNPFFNPRKEEKKAAEKIRKLKSAVPAGKGDEK